MFALQVCLPGLHMSLGIYDRLWELLEAACTALDLLLAKHTSAGALDNSFAEYVAALTKREELNTKLSAAEGRVTTLDQLVTFFSLHTPNAAHNQQLKALREASSMALLGVAAVVNNRVQRLTKLKPYFATQIREIGTVEAFLAKKFKPRDGPHFQSLSRSLDRLHVQRQAYHGGSFVGNHVHKLLQVCIGGYILQLSQLVSLPKRSQRALVFFSLVLRQPP